MWISSGPKLLMEEDRLKECENDIKKVVRNRDATEDLLNEEGLTQEERDRLNGKLGRLGMREKQLREEKLLLLGQAVRERKSKDSEEEHKTEQKTTLDQILEDMKRRDEGMEKLIEEKMKKLIEEKMKKLIEGKMKKLIEEKMKKLIEEKMKKLMEIQPVYYQVTASIAGAKRMKGICAVVYKKAEDFDGRYNGEHERTFLYEGDDLKIKVLFDSEVEAKHFQTFLRGWSMDQPILGLGDSVEVERKVCSVKLNSNPEFVVLQDYEFLETDSPMQTLAELKLSYSSFTAEGVDIEDPFAEFQSIEKPEYFSFRKLYRIHIKDIAVCNVKLKKDESNLIAGSRLLHECFDGMMMIDEMPCLGIRCVEGIEGNEYVEDKNGKIRERVELEILFRMPLVESEISPRLKDGSKRLDSLQWQTFVFVKDAKVFRECVEWKWKKTKATWDAFDQFDESNTAEETFD